MTFCVIKHAQQQSSIKKNQLAGLNIPSKPINEVLQILCKNKQKCRTNPKQSSNNAPEF